MADTNDPNEAAVDLDEKVIAQGRRNANLNQISPNKLKWVHTDAFAYARQMKKNGEQFDAVGHGD